MKDIAERGNVTHNSVQRGLSQSARRCVFTQQETKPVGGDEIELENAAKFLRRDVELFQSHSVQEILTRKRNNKLRDLRQSELMELIETVQNAIYDKREDSQQGRGMGTRRLTQCLRIFANGRMQE